MSKPLTVARHVNQSQIWPQTLLSPIRRGVRSGVSTESLATEAALEPVPASERVPRGSLSQMLWGIDWSVLLPLTMGDGIVVHGSTFEQALPFIREHYAAIFHEDAHSPFSTSRAGSQKERYYRLAGDFFEFKDGDRTMGLLVGTPVDWATYYIRSAAVLPEYAGRRTIQDLLPMLFDVLRSAGIERVQADTNPSNLATIHILNRLRFNVTGTSVTDRWGAQVHLTRFLDEDCEDVFLRQFCGGVKYQLQARSRGQR